MQVVYTDCVECLFCSKNQVNFYWSRVQEIDWWYPYSGIIEDKIIVLRLFALLSCFGLYADSKWIIIEDSTVEDRYFYNQLWKIRNVHSSDVNSVDQFRNKTPNELQDICLSLKNSKIYKRLPLTLQFPEPSNFEKVSEYDGSEYQCTSKPLKLNMGEIIGEISVFLCLTHPGRTYWLTYGYSEFTIFLLQKVQGGKAVSFVGLSVLTPTVDEKYAYRGEAIETYFWSTFEKQAKTGIANIFIHSSQFYLCCMVHAARQRLYPEKKYFTLNYANNDAITKDWPPMEKPIGDSKYEKKNVRSVGCAVNRQGADEIDFYLRPDFEDPTAILVLEEKKYALVVAERFVGISLRFHYSLRYA